MKKNPPLFSTILINRSEGICGTFGEGEKKNHCHQQHWVTLKKKKPIIIFFKTMTTGWMLA